MLRTTWDLWWHAEALAETNKADRKAPAKTDSITGGGGVGGVRDSLQPSQQNVQALSKSVFSNMLLHLSTYTPFISPPFLQFLGGSRFSP